MHKIEEKREHSQHKFWCLTKTKVDDDQAKKKEEKNHVNIDKDACFV